MNNFTKLLMIVIVTIITSCNPNREFDTADQFKHWLEHKHFTSTTNDFSQMDLKGNYSSPIGTLELTFNGNTMQYQNCSPQSYDVYYDMGKWIVGFKKCGNGDLFELVVPTSGDCYVRSIDYDTDKMEQMSGSAISKLDAIASKHSVDGPTMSY